MDLAANSHHRQYDRINIIMEVDIFSSAPIYDIPATFLFNPGYQLIVDSSEIR